MKIRIVDAPVHLSSSLVNYLSPNHSVEIKSYANFAHEDLDADVLFFALRPHNPLFLKHQLHLLDLVDKFQGKLCFIDTSDNSLCPSIYTKYQNFFDRVHCAFLYTETDFTRAKFRRRILYPKFTINYLPPHQVHKNKVVYFRGSLTGGLRLNDKNHRIEAIKKLEQLNSEWSDCKLNVTPNLLQYCPVVKKLMQDEQMKLYILSLSQSKIVQHEDYIKQLGSSSSSLCLPGNAIWCYRHLESMALESNIISLSVDYDAGFWIGRDELDDCFNILNFDLSNLKDVCEYSLSDCNELKEKRKYALDVYRRVFELTPENFYKPATWKCMYEKMQKHSVVTDV